MLENTNQELETYSSQYLLCGPRSPVLGIQSPLLAFSGNTHTHTPPVPCVIQKVMFYFGNFTNLSSLWLRQIRVLLFCIPTIS